MRRPIFIFLVSTCSSLFSQTANRTIRDTIFKVGDVISVPIPDFCLGPGCPDGISLDSYDSLLYVAKFIKRHPHFFFQIETNTDQRGGESANKYLSDNRAIFLRNILITKNGVDSTSLFAKGFGETNPIHSQKQINAARTKEDKENLYLQNRRTALRITGQK